MAPIPIPRQQQMHNGITIASVIQTKAVNNPPRTIATIAPGGKGLINGKGLITEKRIKHYC